jgi:hypothetical protein
MNISGRISIVLLEVLMGQIKMRRIRDSIDARIVKSGFAVF